ncbi:CpaD family pilus assembly protein [Sphingomonas rubra]|uniref:Pilus assembly protein CpaD n=1 Tax=Sphingomonas rubra TaxID=634430 RepID=A0A1I5UEE4_9SPHN|nr:CpaD family pilus assembly lipoprotein [Sphingomonas rubra]SFP93635.1 pilus assembly protein CpaD [Sphingomonas rubra]
MTRTTRRRALLPIAAIAPALAAAGCTGAINRGVESVHQPVVSRADYTIDLATAGGDVAAGEQARLSGWLDGLRLRYGDRISVDDPAHDASAQNRVAAIVAGRGLLLATAAPVTPGTVAPGTLRVVVSRMSASVPGCPDWSRAAGSYVTADASSNYGCATNTNLAAMVANPGDLIQGADGYGNDAATSFKAIDLYRKAVPSGQGGAITKTESTSGGR